MPVPSSRTYPHGPCHDKGLAHGGSSPQARNPRADVLPLEQAVQGAAGQRRSRAQATARGSAGLNHPANGPGFQRAMLQDESPKLQWFDDLTHANPRPQALQRERERERDESRPHRALNEFSSPQLSGPLGSKNVRNRAPRSGGYFPKVSYSLFSGPNSPKARVWALLKRINKAENVARTIPTLIERRGSLFDWSYCEYLSCRHDIHAEPL